jgi:hypothetical protein
MTVAFPAGGFVSAMLIAALQQGELMVAVGCRNQTFLSFSSSIPAATRR